MKYLLMIYSSEELWEQRTPADRDAMLAEYFQLSGDLEAAGKLVGSEELAPAATATKVSVRGGKTIVTDGPFAEAREQLGGFYLVDAADLDDAISIAARIPSARDGVIEVRPVIAHDAPEVES